MDSISEGIFKVHSIFSKNFFQGKYPVTIREYIASHEQPTYQGKMKTHLHFL